ncbi:hypothetical protein [Neorhizobium sp. LjRoot104]|uniref:hypothetical protein n=1 Tax=Neorhizobium sp. LjRoot104 TaxID=3342254 RepID=UPI003ED08E0C
MIRSIAKFTLIFSVSVSTAANANYLQNYSAWKEIPPIEQAAYLAGVMDGWSRTSTPGEPPWMAPQRTGINKCVREQKVDGKMLVELVNEHYRTTTADWRVPPASILKHTIMGLCLEDVNSEREKAGYRPWDRKPAQISP